ncbi:MAG TPA: aldo/keto reductase [Epulopiscium sp.]|nr:aldo/keto reductase [Candidatus Epulonipiscium sp.]
MNTRKIGKSDLDAAVLSLGTWAIGGGSWWGENDDQESIRAIHQALDLGANWIDTAPVYGFSHSEEVVGKAIRDKRNDVIISTKCGLQWYNQKGSEHFSRDGHTVYKDLSPAGIRRDLEYSLKRLGTDYIDVYYTHWQSTPPAFTPIEETMNELLKMKKEGKIRAIGASNVSLENLKEYTQYGQLDVIQEKYSMLDRRIETELLPFCEANNITLQTYSPIEQGLLTGKIASDYEIKPGSVRDNKKLWLPKNINLVNEMLNSWTDLAKKYNCTLGNLVIKWTTMQSHHINVLIGARKSQHVEENLQAFSLNLDPTEIERMTQDVNNLIEKLQTL